MAGQAGADQVKNAINTFLAGRNLPPKQQWLSTFMQSIRLTTPLPALQQTALFRILTTDLINTIQTSQQSCFPANISDPNIKEQKLHGQITVQVLDIEDIGRSRWSQVEAIETEERGETTRGREIVRVVASEDDNANADSRASANVPGGGPHKLLLQDANGTKAYGFELSPVQGVAINMAIGCKLVLREVVFARGLCMLEPRSVESLGGKVDAWDKKWREDRKGVLKEKAGWTADAPPD